jgi:hypothetical protein
MNEGPSSEFALCVRRTRYRLLWHRRASQIDFQSVV